MRNALAERGKAGEDRQALLDDLLAIITDPAVPDERIGWPRLRSAVVQAAPRLPRDHGHLAALDGSYGYLRQFTPQVLAAVRFVGGTTAAGLLEEVEILRALNATGARRVPDDAPDGLGSTATVSSVGEHFANPRVATIVVGHRDRVGRFGVEVPEAALAEDRPPITRDRPVRSARGWSAAPVRHGVSTVRSRIRHTLDLAFRDAA
jgi:oxygenase catalysing oxidative methylation of damaged DNA